MSKLIEAAFNGCLLCYGERIESVEEAWTAQIAQSRAHNGEYQNGYSISRYKEEGLSFD